MRLFEGFSNHVNSYENHQKQSRKNSSHYGIVNQCGLGPMPILCPPRRESTTHTIDWKNLDFGMGSQIGFIKKG